MTNAERAKAVKRIQDEYERETGVRPSKRVAEVILDREQDAKFHKENY